MFGSGVSVCLGLVCVCVWVWCVCVWVWCECVFGSGVCSVFGSVHVTQLYMRLCIPQVRSGLCGREHFYCELYFLCYECLMVVNGCCSVLKRKEFTVFCNLL